MNVAYINPFINATAACFKNMVFVEAKHDTLQVK